MNSGLRNEEVPRGFPLQTKESELINWNGKRITCKVTVM
jgi:hypothetical protein